MREPIQPISDLSNQRISTLYPGLQQQAEQLLKLCAEVIKPMNIVQSFRSMDDQLSIYKIGRHYTEGQWLIVNSAEIRTNARPGLSFHNYGLAFDCAFSGNDPYLKQIPESQRDDIWNKYGELVKKCGFRWGGDFVLKNGAHDKPHAELSYGLSIHECLELYTQEGKLGLWKYIDDLRKG
jgi:peptidoglycan LD-endopeptidase CwlK